MNDFTRCRSVFDTVNVTSARGSSPRRDVLDDHVDADVLLGDGAEDLRAHTGAVLDPHEVHARLVLVVRHAGDDDVFERLVLPLHPGAWSVGERAADVDRHAILHGNLHASDLKHLRAERRELEHLFVRDAINLPGRRADVRIGRVDAVDVGVDLAHPGAYGGSDGYGGRVGAAAPEGRDVAVVVDPLEPGDDGDLAVVHRLEDLRSFDRLDARLGEGAVGEDLHLVSEERARFAPFGLDRHRRQRRRHLLAGGGDGVHLARVGDGGDLVREPEKAVRLAAHRAHDDDDVVPSALGGEAAPRDVPDALERTDGGSTVLLDDESHEVAWK